MIEFCNVTRRYGQRTAVQGLNLTVRPGEVFALLGRNGAGKTTSIKMLVGLLRPDEGRIRICGYDIVSEVRQAVARIGYVPDAVFLYEKLTGREFLEFAAAIRGIPAHEAQRRIERETQRFQLEEFLDALTETYSHGMKQRLVFASALLHDPRVLVIDEPMVGLDPPSVRMVKNLLRELAAQGATVFLSTHILEIAEQIADRIGIFDVGRLRFLGTLEELRRELALPDTSLEQLFLELTETNGHSAPHRTSQTPAAREQAAQTSSDLSSAIPSQPSYAEQSFTGKGNDV